MSDRGPGGGVLDYATRVQRFTLDARPVTARISKFRVKETIKFTDPKGPLSAPTNPSVASPKALNGLNPGVLNGAVGTLGRSFDPEGLVIDPHTGHLIVADEYQDNRGFEGLASVQRDLDQPTMLNGQVVGPVPAGFVLLPGVLHAYRAEPGDLAGYVKPERRGPHHHDADGEDDHDSDHDDHDHGDGRR